MNSIRNRMRATAGDWANDTEFGPLFLNFEPTASQAHNYGIWQDDAAGKDIGGSRMRIAQYSTFGQLLTHCSQGFEPQRRIGLALNPRSLVVRVNCTASMRMQTNAPAGGVAGDGEQGLADASTSGQRLNDTQSGVFVRTAIRFIVFRNMEPGSYPGAGAANAVNETVTWRDIFQVGANAPPSVSDFLNPAQVGRYHVVNDFTVNLSADTPQKNLSIRVPVSKVLRYGGSQANNVRAGHYFIMACAESNIGFVEEDLVANGPLAVPPVILYQHRMAYTDS